jgi:MFS family permease
VDPRLAGRAYSIHQFTGMLGYAAGPALVVALAALGGWRAALAACGMLGLAATLLVGSTGRVLAGHRPAARSALDGGGLGRDLRLLLTTPILSAFTYFSVYATALIGFQTFAVAALGRVYDVPLPVVTGVLTAFLLGSAGGVVAGGILVDRTGHPGTIVTGGLLAAAAVLITLAGATLTPLALTALAATGGFCLGLTSAARDLMVRATIPAAAAGKVFGFAYAGLDLGSAVAPPLFGWLVEHGQPRAVFAAAAALLVLTCGTLAGLRRRPAQPVIEVPADPVRQIGGGGGN